MANTRNPSTMLHGLSAAGVLEFFLERYDMAHASDNELQYLSSCSEAATLLTSSLASITSEIACHVDREGVQTGAKNPPFSDFNQSILLFQIAAEFRLIGQITHIASEADWHLRQRLTDRLKVERSRRGLTDEYSSQEDV
jgi:hypothetical protein